ncbi:class I SAM-dependent methyltransferase [Pelagicoccus albus]|uniref:Class I SAM-dependent methyltransferase n=1 Tax=Pelagicoccus albus TaxID=415222 RepID=A0A7X1E8M6_9BACT|nr:class I SAM-dependent methyltransferase [Pelagicoccus albus]MBC2604942.1 class I SAM-dependent methyltransferase [Pelagicoccus albus]
MNQNPVFENESLIVCKNSQGTLIRATVMRMTRYLVSFEVYNPYSILQLSEVLGDFEIIINARCVYRGRAIVSNMINTGLVLICEGTLDEESWIDMEMLSPSNQLERLADDFERLIQDWRKLEAVSPELKVSIADIESLLADLQRWTEQLEVTIRSAPESDRSRRELDLINRINALMAPLVAEQFGRFEEVASSVSEEATAIHRAYCRRQLHPLVMCAPFVHRTYDKPLGYAGDYEMVNMILRNPAEGASIFAKVVNSTFLASPPAEAHRNRIDYLVEMLNSEVERGKSAGRATRIFNLGCGPAMEVQKFLEGSSLCDAADFSLLDFNEETLQRTGRLLEDLKSQYGRSTPLRTIKRSVNQILREGPRIGRDGTGDSGYDVVYCAGLFDYLSDRVCQRLLEIFYEMVAPGGVVVATNVDESNPVKGVMEYVMEWHLIYRNAEDFMSLAPRQAPKDCLTLRKDVSGVNLFLEIRKPAADA